MMKGTYRFYTNGELVATSENLITDKGKKAILYCLAGMSSNIGGALAVGVQNTPATSSDDRLTYEVARVSISLSSVDYNNNPNLIIFKGTIPQEDSYTVYEAGLWNRYFDVIAGENSSRNLTEFNQTLENWTNVTLVSTNGRIGADAARVDAAANATVNVRADVVLDLSGYSVNDEFKLAFYKPDNNVSSLTLVFASSAGTATLTKSITALPVGYNVLSFRKGDFTGTVDWANLTTYGVDVTAGATGSYVILDGIRIEDMDSTNTDYVMVSRSALATPVVKTNVAPMDIEYALEINVT